MTDLKTELDRAMEFNALLGQEVGNRDALYLQSSLLVEEGIKELSEAVYKQDRLMLRDALADTAVICAGGVRLCGYDLSSEIADQSVSCVCNSADYVFIFSAGLVGHTLNNSKLDVISDDYKTVMYELMDYSANHGIDLAEDLKSVNDSNLSKFCLSEDEANKTVNSYMARFNLVAKIKETGNKDYPLAVYSAESNGNFPEGKLLKSVNYKKPVFID